jgi:hypothetical protein
VGCASSYVHGEYTNEDSRSRRYEPFIELFVHDPDDMDGDPLSDVFISPEAARKLARGLEYAADALDGSDRPVERAW